MLEKEDLYEIACRTFQERYEKNGRSGMYNLGFGDGYNKAMKEWRDCFMSCSSPYCADKFRDIQCGGILGNMTKEVRDGSVE